MIKIAACTLLVFFLQVDFAMGSELSCDYLKNNINRLQVHIPSYQSGAKIVGAGVVTVYELPSYRCGKESRRLPVGTKLNVYSDFNGFTSVLVAPLKPGEGEIMGWVRSNRLRPTGTGIGPNYDEQKVKSESAP